MLNMGCYQIANTANQHKKNEIFVETVASTLIGVASTYGIGLLLFSNPVGWGVALVLGTAAAVGSYGAGKGATMVYDKFLHKHDLVTLTGVDRLCQ